MKIRFAIAPGIRHFSADALDELVESCERLGFDTLWLSDVPLGPIGDPLVSLTYAAGRTTRLKLGANVVPLGRNPMLLARELVDCGPTARVLSPENLLRARAMAEAWDDHAAACDVPMRLSA